MWGDPSPVDYVVVDGARVPIAANLARAMECLRNLKTPNPILIWIDAICINQSDLIERGDQVAMMRLVYRNADCVRIWMNETIDKDSPAVSALKNFRIPLLHRDEADNPRPQDLGLGTDRYFWYHLVPIFQNDYWSRIWIQQEVLNASRLEVHCSNVSFSGTYLICLQEAVSRLLSWDYESLDKGLIDNAFEKLKVSEGLIGLYLFDSYLLRRPLGDLVNLMEFCDTLHASKGSDRIYAIMHLARDFEEGDIVVDYARPAAYAMLQAAAHHVNRHRNLQFLDTSSLASAIKRGTQTGREITSLRTWVPDAWYARDIGLVGNQVLQRIPRHRCSPHPIDMQSMHLGVRGIKFGSVRQCLRTECEDSSTVSEFWRAPFGPYLQSQYSTNWTKIPRSLSEILTCEPRAISSYEEIASGLSVFFLSNQDDKVAERKLGGLVKEMVRIPAPVRTALVHIMDALKLRAIILTERGSQGLVPTCDIMAGDELWILLGCDSTVTLRRQSDGTYWHVCTVYFPSIQGHDELQMLVTESMPGNKVGEWTVEDIKIA
jgi:hypothetical protein